MTMGVEAVHHQIGPHWRVKGRGGGGVTVDGTGATEAGTVLETLRQTRSISLTQSENIY